MDKKEYEEIEKMQIFCSQMQVINAMQKFKRHRIIIMVISRE